MLRLLKAEKGALIVGALTGSTVPGEGKLGPPFFREGGVKTVFKHSEDSFREMWGEIADSEGLDGKLDVWAEYRARAELGDADDVKKHAAKTTPFKESSWGQRRLFFIVTRL